MGDLRTEILKELIVKRGFNPKSFANKIDIPYTTLRSILSRGIGNATVDNVIKICRGLGITTEQLLDMSVFIDDIGAILRDERNSVSESVEKFAEVADLSVGDLNAIEEEIQPISLYSAKRIAAYLGYTWTEFLFENGLYDDVLPDSFESNPEGYESYKLAVKRDVERESEKKHQIETIAAHIDENVTEDEIEDIKKYIEFIKSQRKN